MLKRLWDATLLGSLALCGPASGQGAPAYLTPAATPDGARVLPPPPKPGSAAAMADRRIFLETRAAQGSPRWRLAASDVDTDAFDHSPAPGLPTRPRWSSGRPSGTCL